MRVTVKEAELQRYWGQFCFVLSPGPQVGMHRFDLEDKYQSQQALILMTAYH